MSFQPNFLSLLKENEHLRDTLSAQEKKHGMEMDHMHRALRERVAQVRDQYVDFTASILNRKEREGGAQPGGGGGGGGASGGVTPRSGGGKTK